MTGFTKFGAPPWGADPWRAAARGAALFCAAALLACGPSEKKDEAATGEAGDAKASAPENQIASAPPALAETNPGLNFNPHERPSPSPTPTPLPELRAVAPPEPASQGTAEARLVEHPHEAGTTPYSHGRVGDYILKNELLALVFTPASQDRPGEPGDPSRDPRKNRPRNPGALIDAYLRNERADFMEEFTQGIGIDLLAPAIVYDEAKFVTREAAPSRAAWSAKPAAAGVRLAGSPEHDPSIRVETTYWLAPGETRVEVESRILAGEPATPVADIGRWGPGLVIGAVHGPPPAEGPERRELPWYAARGGTMAVGVAAYGGRLEGNFAGNRSRVEAVKEEDGKILPLASRWIFFAHGNLSNVTDPMLQMGSELKPVGRLRGTIANYDSKQGDPDAWAAVFTFVQGAAQLDRRLYTRARTDKQGRYDVLLPEGRYFVAAASRARATAQPATGLERSVDIQSGGMTERDLYVGPPATLKIRVVDSKTKAPLAARARLTPIPPTPSTKLFESIADSLGFVDSFYVHPVGASVELWEGKWDLTVTGGINYDYVQLPVEMKWGKASIVEVELPETSPTPGWIGVEVGAMTLATPNCALTDDDVVLSAAGEGLDWIVSGDWETITDLRPAIKRTGLQDRLNASRGFRTSMRTRPEWGTFMVYPVAEDAPRPEEAKVQWIDLEKASDFVAALRRLYPGALIEATNAFGEKSGYFNMPGKNFAQISWDPNPEVELGIDAVGLFDPQGVFDFKRQKDFWFIHTLRGRVYLPVPTSNRLVAFGSEPGYPRLLLKTGEENASKLTEAQLMEAIRARKWQITSGPYIDLEVEGKREGEVFAGGKVARGKLRITAPNWSPSNRVDMSKEGLMDWFELSQAAAAGAVRLEREFETKLYPEFKEGKDTELASFVQGTENIDPAVPAYGGPGRPSVAMTSPIVADANGNAAWDPPNFRDKGK